MGVSLLCQAAASVPASLGAGWLTTRLIGTYRWNPAAAVVVGAVAGIAAGFTLAVLALFVSIPLAVQ
jgi:hypothetical protein